MTPSENWSWTSYAFIPSLYVEAYAPEHLMGRSLGKNRGLAMTPCQFGVDLFKMASIGKIFYYGPEREIRTIFVCSRGLSSTLYGCNAKLEYPI